MTAACSAQSTIAMDSVVTPRVVASNATYVGADTRGPAEPPSHRVDSAATSTSPYLEVSPEAIARILVLASTHIDRPSEVVGVVDANAPAGQYPHALLELRRRAAFVHADAVLGVESHQESDGPVHLSGLAVRFVDVSSGY